MQQTSIEQKPFISVSRKNAESALLTLLFIAGFVSVALTYLSFVGIVSFLSVPSLLKIDLLILLGLLFVLGRRITSIFMAHKKNIAASGLHMKLVLLFSAVSLIPAAFMAFFSLFFFHFGVQSWFSEQIKTAVIESNSIAESYLEEHQNTIRADILAMANDLDRQYAVFVDNNRALKQMMDTQIFYRNLTGAVLFSDSFEILSHSGIDAMDISHITGFDLEDSIRDDVSILHSPKDDNVQAIVKLNAFSNMFLLVGRGVDATVLSRVERTRAAAVQYDSLEGQLVHIRYTLIAIYVALSVFLVLASIGLALRMARRFIQPIESLVDASNRVRAGDLDIALEENSGVVELDQLTQAYNRMTAQLSKQRHELVSANRQLDERRLFIETVLAGVSSGVISVNHQGEIKLYNAFAEDILKGERGELSGLSIFNVIPQVESVLRQTLLVDSEEEQSFQIEIPFIDSKGNKKDIFLRAVSEVLNGKNIGAIITFDDITSLKSAQRTAAWSDVARRIAHEIKNPLTPIQLSADRLRKKFGGYIPEADRDIFDTCIETISCHVDDIGAMVSEFSSFARMPEPKMTSVNLSALLTQSITLHREGHKGVTIDLVEETEVASLFSDVLCDEQMIRQAFTNILQNAIDSILDRLVKEKKVSVWLHSYQGDIYITVRDTGGGFPDGEDPERILDPYVTFKKNGTGLGLAIVKKIMSDHNGKIVLGELDWMTDLVGWNDMNKVESGAVVSLMLPHSKQSNQVGKKSKA